ncbi:uncharacterized protein V6R79_000111 [Siganus canaliculatus]
MLNMLFFLCTSDMIERVFLNAWQPAGDIIVISDDDDDDEVISFGSSSDEEEGLTVMGLEDDGSVLVLSDAEEVGDATGGLIPLISSDDGDSDEEWLYEDEEWWEPVDSDCESSFILSASSSLLRTTRLLHLPQAVALPPSGGARVNKCSTSSDSSYMSGCMNLYFRVIVTVIAMC